MDEATSRTGQSRSSDDASTSAPADRAEDAEKLLSSAAEKAEQMAEDLDAASAARPFGRPGRPLRRTSPFYVGFVGGLGVLVAYVVAQALLHARQVLVLVLASLVLAIGLNPFVERLSARGMKRSVAVAIVAIAVILAFVGFIAAVAPPLARQTTELVASLPDQLARLRANTTIQRLDAEYHLIERLSNLISGGGLATSLFGGVVGFGKVVLASVFGALTVLILTIYFLAAYPRMKHHAYLMVPRSRRQRVQLLGDEILSRTGGYVSGALLIASLAGVSSLVFLPIVRVPYALTLALVVGILDLVPMVGATAGAAVATLVALTDSVQKALACVVFYVLYQQFENYVIYPRVMSRSVDVSPALTLVAALVGGALLGVIGALLAIPAAAALSLLFHEVVVPRQSRS